MIDDIQGMDISLWIDTTKSTDYSRQIETKKTFDVAIAGGGITGLMAAWYLQNEGLNTAVVEKNRIVENTTGNTTAKLTSQHYLVYDHLITSQGLDVAKAYAKANEDAIDEIERISQRLDIDCDFSRRDAFVYTRQDKKIAEIKKEAAAAKKIGLPASFVSSIELPVDAKGAVKFSNQAQFHPRKFLLPIASAVVRRGGHIYENTAVTGIKTGSISGLETNYGSIKAKYIIEATKYPFWKPDIFKGHTWTKLSYALGIILKKGSSYPQGMYITTDVPTRTVRSHPYKSGEMLIFGGESHKLEPGYDKNLHYNNLIKDVKKSYDVDKIIYRWIAGDNMSNDLMPYIGPYHEHPNIFISTGYRAWGLAWAVAAARIIRDEILGKPADWAEPFGLERLIR